MTLGEWIRRRRGSLGLTQAELAARVPCSTIAIRKIEAGERRPSRSVAESLAGALELDGDRRERFVDAARRSLAPTGDATELSAFEVVRPPAPLTPLIGRRRELDELVELLSPSGGPARLVALTGPPGVGKTRLAVELADRVRQKFDILAVYVDLAGVTDGASIPAALAAAVGGVVTAGGDLLDLVSHRLRREAALLVVDSFEQLVADAPVLVRLLEACPALVCVVTSRAPLGVAGGFDFALEPFLLDDPDDRAAALELFGQRARAADRRVTDELTDELVGEVCGLLDGLPLAIELVAARCATESVQGLRESLRTGVEAPTAARRSGRSEDLLSRTITSSTQRLDDEARQAFLAAALFARPCSVDDVAAVADQPLETAQAAVRRIADQSLVRWRAGVPRPIEMLAPIRRHGRAVLAGAPDPDRWHRRHAQRTTTLVEAVSGGLTSWPEPAAIVGVTELDADVSEALDWCLGRGGDVTIARRLVEGVIGVWWVRGRLAECAAVSERLQRAMQGRPDAYVADELLGACEWFLGDPHQRAQRLLRSACDAARAADDAMWTAEALGVLQLDRIVHADLQGARALQGEALGWSERAGPGHVLSANLTGFRVALLEGDLDGASEHARAVREVGESTGDRFAAAAACGMVADVAAARRDAPGALEAYLEAYERFDEIGYAPHAATALSGVAAVLARDGRLAEAGRVLELLDDRLDEQGVSILPWAMADDAEARRLVAAAGEDAVLPGPDGRADTGVVAVVEAAVGGSPRPSSTASSRR